jgi:chaperonin GroES
MLKAVNMEESNKNQENSEQKRGFSAVLNGEPKIQPLADRVLIKELKEDSKTVSGIILPNSLNNEEEMKKGRVIEVGSGKTVNGNIIPISVKKGDKVLFKKWADKIKFEGEEYYLANESDLVAIIK